MRSRRIISITVSINTIIIVIPVFVIFFFAFHALRIV